MNPVARKTKQTTKEIEHLPLFENLPSPILDNLAAIFIYWANPFESSSTIASSMVRTTALVRTTGRSSHLLFLSVIESHIDEVVKIDATPIDFPIIQAAGSLAMVIAPNFRLLEVETSMRGCLPFLVAGGMLWHCDERLCSKDSLW